MIKSHDKFIMRIYSQIFLPKLPIFVNSFRDNYKISFWMDKAIDVHFD